MHCPQPVRRARVSFALTLLAGVVLYFLTPYLPTMGDGVLFGAFGVAAFAGLVLVRAVAMLQRSTLSNAVLAGTALVAALGVCGVHQSLYQFAPMPPLNAPTVWLEHADRVLLVEQRREATSADRLVAAFPKRFWLLKTFALNGLLLVVATALGVLLGRQVEKASHLWAIVVLGAVMDLWSVTVGVTATIVASTRTAYAVLLNWPLAGQGGVTYPLIGATDALFVALFLFLVHKFRLGLCWNVLELAGAMTLAILSAVVLQRGVPALPYLGASMLIVNGRLVLPARKEWLQIAVGAVVILGLCAMLWHGL